MWDPQTILDYPGIRQPPLGTISFCVVYELKERQYCTVLELENNSMVTTNLIYEFYRKNPTAKILKYQTYEQCNKPGSECRRHLLNQV